MAGFTEKDQSFDQGGAFKPGDNVDLERRGSTTVAGRKMSRIGPPPRNSSIVPVSDDNSVVDEYGKLVEMEAGDAIKYRTCSWQKVGYILPSSMRSVLLTFSADCCPTLLRVHLFGHHVFPLLVLGSWSRAWPHLDRGSSRIRALHFARCLVSDTIKLEVGQFNTDPREGNSVCDILRSGMFVTLGKCSSGAPSGLGISRPSCSCSTTPSFKVSTS
jgi:hypothetical protein